MYAFTLASTQSKLEKPNLIKTLEKDIAESKHYGGSSFLSNIVKNIGNGNQFAKTFLDYAQIRTVLDEFDFQNSLKFTRDKSQSYKKTHGEVFTSRNVAKLMAGRVSKYIDLKGRSVCDFACGNGILLSEILNSYPSIDLLIGNDIQKANAKRTLLNLKAQMSLQKNTAVKTKTFSFDSILGSNRFEQKYDVVISNPPYIGQKYNRHVFEPIKTHRYWSRHYARKCDMLYYFIILGLDLLRESGILCLLTSQYWITATSAQKIREYVLSNGEILELHDFGSKSLFKDAPGQENIIILIRKNSSESKLQKSIKVTEYSPEAVDLLKRETPFELEEKEFSPLLIKREAVFCKTYYSKTTQKRLTGSPWYFKGRGMGQRTNESCRVRLGAIIETQPGIQTGADKVNKRNKFVSENINKLDELKLSIGDGIYVLSSLESQRMKLSRKERAILRPFFKSTNLSPYICNHRTSNLIIFPEEIDCLNDYPAINNHMSKYKSLLAERYKTYSLRNEEGAGRWWKLVGARNGLPFEEEKVLHPARTKDPSFTYSNLPFYASMDIYYSYSKPQNSFSLKFIVALLNSKYCKKYLEFNCKKKGIKFELYKEPISQMPLTSNLQSHELIKADKEIGGIYSTKEKPDYGYHCNTHTWIKQMGIFDYLTDALVLKGTDRIARDGNHNVILDQEQKLRIENAYIAGISPSQTQISCPQSIAYLIDLYIENALNVKSKNG